MSETEATAPAASAPARRLLTARIIELNDLLRRSGTIANRRAFGLSYIDWRVMAQVGEHAPLSLNDLADLLILDRGQLSRAVKALVGRGLLRSQRRRDGPSIMITLSEAGEALHARMIELIRARHRFLVSDLDEEEVERVAALLDIVTRRARQLLDQERATDPEPGDVAGEPPAT